MKYNLPCAAVRDLLPLYVEGLTEPETAQALREHLEGCEGCRAHLEAMRENTALPEPPPEKEVDYLKAVRRKSRVKILLSVLATVLVLAAGAGAKLFWIGTPAGPDTLAYTAVPVTENGAGAIRFSVFSTDSACALRGLETETQDGILQITVRKVLASPFYRSGDLSAVLPCGDIREIRFGDMTVYADGTPVDRISNLLYQNRTPYIGSLWRAAKLDPFLPLPEGRNYTNELQTGAEPYGRTLIFEETLTEAEQVRMEKSAALMLALIGNLGEVSWRFPDASGETVTRTVTADDALAMAGAGIARYNKTAGEPVTPESSIKNYAQSPEKVRLLRALTGVL